MRNFSSRKVLSSLPWKTFNLSGNAYTLAIEGLREKPVVRTHSMREMCWEIIDLWGKVLRYKKAGVITNWEVDKCFRKYL